MDLTGAVALLNSQKHRGRDNWRVQRDCAYSDDAIDDFYLLEFEAIAIAEKYLREGGPYPVQSPSGLWPERILAEWYETNPAHLFEIAR